MVAPVFTSSNFVTINEGLTSVVPLTATDADGDSITFTLKSGLDKPFFKLNGNTLEFIAPRDFEDPKDNGANNTYLVTVIATDSTGAKTEQTITVTIADVTGVTLDGTSGDDLVGPVGATVDGDTLNGLAGNDTLDGGLGSDTMNGGDGNDVYIVETADILNNLGVVTTLGDVVNETGTVDSDADEVRASISYVLGANLENLTLTGSNKINGTGNALDNVITGNDDKNVIDGGEGADTMAGGEGTDTYIVDNVGDVVTENSGEGFDDEVQSSVSYTLSDNIEILTLTGTAYEGRGNAGNNTINGNLSDNDLYGEDGNDVLIGNGGHDHFYGGKGNDTFYTDGNAHFFENADEGTDTIVTTSNISLQDLINGGDAQVINVENVTLAGTAISATGHTGNNKLIGNELANLLIGRAGNDRLEGGEGTDTMNGGSGDDVYVVDDPTDVIIEAVGLVSGGKDTVIINASYTMADNLERLTMGFSAGPINATGNAGNNVMIGNSAANMLTGLEGNDRLDGGIGIDTMVGGDGNDAYYLNVITDVVTELAAEGTDKMFVSGSAGTNWTIVENVENIKIQGLTAQNATGNTLDNVMTGNSQSNSLSGLGGNDTLDGGRGVDTMIGGEGDDQYFVDVSGDVVTEVAGQGTDTVNSKITFTLADHFENLTLLSTGNINGTGNSVANVITGNRGNNVLNGGGGDDTINGGAGNDTLNGGAGADTMNGGSGTDKFVFTSASDADGDSIVNFTSGETIDLSAIDWDTVTGGDQAFVMDANGTFVAGEVDIIVLGTTATVNLYTDNVDGVDASFTVSLPVGATEVDMLFIL
jgi:Ca2+-binding RTX toxin-like protein